MKIAMPYNEGRINEHFGASREFVIYTIEDGEITGSKIINSHDLCHNHEGLAGLLREEGVEVVIAGGIGHPMMNAIQALGFKIVTGASGDAARVAVDYASGSLNTSDIDICSCSH
jgi:predicted Fe-Mo cluster-binding NifX family protein